VGGEGHGRRRVGRIAQVSLLRRLETNCLRMIAEEGLVTTDGTIAVVGTGALNTETAAPCCQSFPPAHGAGHASRLQRCGPREGADAAAGLAGGGAERPGHNQGISRVELISFADL